jgi:transposase InsO family protein
MGFAALIRYHAPAVNAHCERFIGTLKRECLDRFIALGTGHLDYLVREFVSYYIQRQKAATVAGAAGPSWG